MKTILQKDRHVIVQIICYLYIFLFVYTAISKLLDFENFWIQLAQSPLLSAYIDTISRAQVQVRSLSDGRHKMDAPPLQVNKRSVVHHRVLFNESNLMGKFESREMWRQAAIVDMYRTDRQEYPGSFYVPERVGHKMTRMIVTDGHFFVLSGNEIVRYRFAQPVTRHFIKTGEAENPH